MGNFHLSNIDHREQIIESQLCGGAVGQTETIFSFNDKIVLWLLLFLVNSYVNTVCSKGEVTKFLLIS